MRPFKEKGWLAALVDEALGSHEAGVAQARPAPGAAAGPPVDFAAAARIVVARSLRARRPSPAQPEDSEGFRELVLHHVVLLLDLRLLAPIPPAPERARAEVAAFLAAALDQEALALAALDGWGSRAQVRAARLALEKSGEELLSRFHPPGDPRSGLPLSSGATAVFRRHLARVVGGFARAGGITAEALERHAEYAARELSLLAEALSGLMGTVEPPDRRARAVRARQMARLGLRGALLREARGRVAEPRAAEELAVVAPEPMRSFLFEQLLLAQLRARLPGEAPGRFVDAFAQGAGLDPQVVVAAQLEAAAQSGDPQAWFEGVGGEGAALDWHALADDWGAAADKVVERVATAVTQNLGALATEIRETGELGTLLTRAAAGGRLTADEKRKVRAQLIDLAKAVPALAMFAAPGGSLLLPILVKLLPFNLLPSAWDKVGAEPRAQAQAAAPGADEEKPEAAAPGPEGGARPPKPAA